MAYMSASASSILVLEYLDTNIAMVCSEMPFGGGSCRVETGQLVHVVGYLT